MAQKELRNYEISIWSLQDDFITVLKHSDIRDIHKLRDARMSLNVDGTQTLSFSIPMYIIEDGVKKENPIWYNYINGMIISSMRKIKVILNKMTSDEEIYEFLIVKVTESHQGEEMFCEVECEGLAFHELGKIGYKISLSEEKFYADDLEAFNKNKTAPKATLQYWLKEIVEPYPNTGYVNPRTWYYQVQMDWSGYTRYNGSNFTSRAIDKIYEDEYVSSWTSATSSDAILTPSRIEGYKEKERMVNLEESNIYNLTQDLAEIFGVYCKYVYEHNSEYRITSRKIIFYNSFIEEDKGALDITYKYNTSAISREMDGTDIVTKMYVRPVNNENTASGYSTIMDVGANKSREDYLLNFDYMYSIGAINQEAYNEIQKYEKKMHDLNLQIIPQQESLANLESKKPEIEARKNFYADARRVDQEQINEANDLRASILSSSGGNGSVLKVTADNPKLAVLVENLSAKYSNAPYYISITEKGVISNTIKIYRTANLIAERKKLSDPVTGWSVEYDEFNNVSKIVNITKGNEDGSTVYLTYSYNPQLHYDNVKKVWQNRLAMDEAGYNHFNTELTNIDTRIDNLKTKIEANLQAKKKIIKSFEQMMGPALREGYWQPDDFNDYGDVHLSTINVLFSGTVAQGSTGMDSFVWDNDLFDDEQKIYYSLGANEQKKYYPVVFLDNDTINSIKDKLNDLSFLFYGYDTEIFSADRRRVYVLGSQCQLGFVRNKSSKVVRPILILTGAEKLSDTEIGNLNKRSPALGNLSYKTAVSNPGLVEEIYANVEVSLLNNNYEAVYPRLKIDSLSMKTSEDQLSLKYRNVSLTNLNDYYILTRTDEYTNNVTTSSYYITLKPEVLIKNYGTGNNPLSIKFCISNADTSIYLDAIQVLKDSSYPQVSYSLDVALVQNDYIKKVSKILNRIVHINDYELKFENVQGYVSEVNLDLERPWQDSISIKNYKTKFEDLFTKIVASTEQMKKNEYVSKVISQAFTSAGQLKQETLQVGLNKADLNYAFNNGKLTIDEANGIWGISDSGVVAFRGGGIFTANEKDGDGNWIWNTGIIPSGINAKLLTSGQLDTNKISIYAGDDLRFVLNGNGLFAYKSIVADDEFLELMGNSSNYGEGITQTELNDYYNKPNIDGKQYVVFNSEGLALIAKNGSYRIKDNKIEKVNRDIKRVEIGWDGIKLRNWENAETLWIDADTGDARFAGHIISAETKVYTDRDELEGQSFDAYLSSKMAVLTDIAGKAIASIYDAIDDSLYSNLNSDFLNELKKAKTKPIYLLSIPANVTPASEDDAKKNYAGVIIDPDDGIYLKSTAGIYMNSSEYNAKLDNVNQAAVKITPEEITLGVGAEPKSSGLVIKSDSISLVTSTSLDASLISLDSDGIYIGKQTQRAGDTFITLTENSFEIGSSTNIKIHTANLKINTDDNSNNGTIFKIGKKDGVTMELKSGGELKVTGITAEVAKIGPWNISNSGIYMNSSTFGNEKGIYFGEQGLSFFDVFKIKINKDEKYLEAFEFIDKYRSNTTDGDKTLLSIKRVEDEGNFLYQLHVGEIYFDEDTLKKYYNSRLSCRVFEEVSPNSNLWKSMDENYPGGKDATFDEIKNGEIYVEIGHFGTYKDINDIEMTRTKEIVLNPAVTESTKDNRRTIAKITLERWNVIYEYDPSEVPELPLPEEPGEVLLAAAGSASSTSGYYEPPINYAFQLEGPLIDGGTGIFFYLKNFTNSLWGALEVRFGYSAVQGKGLATLYLTENNISGNNTVYHSPSIFLDYENTSVKFRFFKSQLVGYNNSLGFVLAVNEDTIVNIHYISVAYASESECLSSNPTFKPVMYFKYNDTSYKLTN